MHVRAIAISRFTCHRALRVDLPRRGILLITGPNGAGKTSILEAVAWAAFGESIRGAEPWPDEKGDTSAVVDLDTGGEPLRVHRTATVAVRAGKATAKGAVTWRPVPPGEAMPTTLPADHQGEPEADTAPVVTRVAAPVADPAFASFDTPAQHPHPRPRGAAARRGEPEAAPEAPIYENATKAEGALAERVGPFDRWCRTHVFLARDAARFAAATDGERKRALEAILGLGAFDAALKQCRVEAREVASRLASTDGALAAWRDAYTRASMRAAAPVPEAPTPEALDDLRGRLDAAVQAVRVAADDTAAAERSHGVALGERAAAATTAAQLAATLRSLTAPPPPPLTPRPAHTHAAQPPVPVAPVVAAPPACPTCKRPWVPLHAPTTAPAMAPPPPGPTPNAAAPEGPATGHHPQPAPTPGPTLVAAPDLAPLHAALSDAEDAARAAGEAVTITGATLTAARATHSHAAALPVAIATELATGERAVALRGAALAALAAAAREAEELACRITNAEADTADLRAEAAALAAADTALGLGGIRARILSHALPFLGHRATTWLSRLGRPEWRVSFASTRKTGVRGAQGEEAITMTLDGPPKPQYAALSGGEGKRVDLALLLALGELATAVHGAPTGTLWFDEVLDAPLDAEGAAVAAEALRALARDRAVVVIAHSPDVVRTLRPVAHLDLGGADLGGA